MGDKGIRESPQMSTRGPEGMSNLQIRCNCSTGRHTRPSFNQASIGNNSSVKCGGMDFSVDWQPEYVSRVLGGLVLKPLAYTTTPSLVSLPTLARLKLQLHLSLRCRHS